MSIILPGRRGFSIATTSSVLEEDKAIAWEAAKDRIVPRIDMGWIMSNYVDLSPPEDLRPNENGHIFTLADGEKHYRMVQDTPLNWLHHDRFIVGHHVEAELMYHLEGEPVSAADGTPARPPGGHVETLAAFYRRIYPEQWSKVKDAHDAGLLHSSMEALPDTVTCQTDGCCGETFPFDGAWSKTYCEAMQKPSRSFLCNDPLFIGGAVVVPPHRPGWRDASAIEVATYLEKHPQEAERMFAAVSAAHPDLDDDTCETILAALLAAAHVGEGEARSRMSMQLPSGKRIDDFTFHLPPDLVLPTVEEVRALMAPRQTAALEAQANHQGVIVALVPPTPVAEALSALGDEPVEQIHVTLAFLGDSDGEDQIAGPDGPVTVERLDAMLAVFAASERPVSARVSGLGRFDAPGDSEVTYASIDSPGLNELRARLVDYLNASGAPVSMDHGFTPHATVQYHRPGEGPTDLPEGLEWNVESIELWWGDALHSEHRLGGVDEQGQLAAALAIEAISALTLHDPRWVELGNRFLAVASVDTLQAVLDTDVDYDGRLEPLIAGVLIDRKFSSDERATLAKNGQAMPDGSFPTPTKADWRNAKVAVGRASDDDRGAVIAYLKRRAKALGIEDEIPDTW